MGSCHCKVKFKGFVAPKIDFFFMRQPNELRSPIANLTLKEADTVHYVYEYNVTRDFNDRTLLSRLYFDEFANIPSYMTQATCGDMDVNCE